jgi:hypothetical protein
MAHIRPKWEKDLILFLTLQGIYSRKPSTFTFLKTTFHFILLHNHPAPPFSVQDDHHNFSPALLEIICRPLFASPAHEIKITAVHF